MHETNTFAPGRTAIEAFHDRVYLSGEEIVDAGRGTDSALGGVIDAAAGRASLVPVLFASAMPGPPVANETFEALAGELTDRLRQAARGYPGLAGVVLLVHGAMVTVSDFDPEGTLLERVRAIVGPRCPVVVTLDSHATITSRMVSAASRITAYRTYPHLDTRARGAEAMETCLRLAVDRTATTVVHRKLPLIMPLLAQGTDPGSPMTPLLDRANEWRARPGIESVVLVPGFPYADVPDAGASVIVHGDRTLASLAADDLATCWWNLRSRFRLGGLPLDRLLDRDTFGTIVVADIADNPGAGASARDTSLLRHFLSHRLRPAAFACIVDPGPVEACHRGGIGAVLELVIGEPPIESSWRVDHLGDGVFTNQGPMATGAVNRIGRTATVSRDGISVILCERRAQVVDPAVFPACGITPDGYRWLVVKSSVHFRAAFRVVASEMIEIEGQGSCSSDLTRLTYLHVPRPIWPLDPDAEWLRTD